MAGPQRPPQSRILLASGSPSAQDLPPKPRMWDQKETFLPGGGPWLACPKHPSSKDHKSPNIHPAKGCTRHPPNPQTNRVLPNLRGEKSLVLLNCSFWYKVTIFFKRPSQTTTDAFVTIARRAVSHFDSTYLTVHISEKVRGLPGMAKDALSTQNSPSSPPSFPALLVAIRRKQLKKQRHRQGPD